MEISLPVINIAVVGFITFVLAIIFKPAALVARDYLLWQGINHYLKKSNFQLRVFKYSVNRARYLELTDNNELVKDSRVQPTKYWIGNKEVDKKRFDEEQRSIESTRQQTLNLMLRINKEKAAIGSILRHFDQEEGNPIPEIVKEYEDKFYKPNN